MRDVSWRDGATSVVAGIVLFYVLEWILDHAGLLVFALTSVGLFGTALAVLAMGRAGRFDSELRFVIRIWPMVSGMAWALGRQPPFWILLGAGLPLLLLSDWLSKLDYGISRKRLH